MRSRRIAPLLALTAAALVAAVPAPAKEGVKATLGTRIPLDAPAGTRFEVAWTLFFADEGRKRRSFGAGGVFVRLSSASGERPQTAFAREDTGRYTATAMVPKGGIGDVRIGLRGWTDGKRADLLFPITNDPLPGPARVSSRAPTQRVPKRSTTASTAEIVALAVGGLLAVAALLGILILRRRPRLSPPSRAV